MAVYIHMAGWACEMLIFHRAFEMKMFVRGGNARWECEMLCVSVYIGLCLCVHICILIAVSFTIWISSEIEVSSVIMCKVHIMSHINICKSHRI